MDALSEVLQTLELSGSLYARTELGAPWGLGVERLGVAVFHIVARGGGFILREGEKAALPWARATWWCSPRAIPTSSRTIPPQRWWASSSYSARPVSRTGARSSSTA